MGLNFHPRVIGVMAVKDHRNKEFHMLETAAFDPIWTEFNSDRLGECSIPCFHDYGQIFKGKNGFPLKDEWEAYQGEPLKLASSKGRGHFWEMKREVAADAEGRSDEARTDTMTAVATYDRDALSKAEYKIEEDSYPPTNRTMENFFRGAWTYHIHNQVRLSLRTSKHNANSFSSGAKTLNHHPG
jgi:hypothetical protein